MAIKKLSYRAFENNEKGEGIDPRLGQAHTHGQDNSDVDIINELPQRVQDLEESRLKVDFSNADPDAVKSAVLGTGHAFHDVEATGKCYVRRNGMWVLSSSVISVPEIEVNTEHFTITEGETDSSGDVTKKRVQIDLSEATTNKLADISKKLNKLESADEGTIVVAAAGGGVKKTDVGIANVITKDALETSISRDPSLLSLEESKRVASSAYATFQLYEKILELQSGISSCKGCVVNAYRSSSSAKAVTRVKIVASGSNYNEGEVISITHPSTIVPLRMVIAEVDAAGGVLSIESDESAPYQEGVYNLHSSYQGFYQMSLQSDETEYAVYGGSGVGASIRIVETDPVDKSTLFNIVSPAPGDTAYVIEDENHNNKTSVYVCVNTSSEQDSLSLSWIHVATIGGSNNIVRYES